MITIDKYYDKLKKYRSEKAKVDLVAKAEADEQAKVKAKELAIKKKAEAAKKRQDEIYQQHLIKQLKLKQDEISKTEQDANQLSNIISSLDNNELEKTKAEADSLLQQINKISDDEKQINFQLMKAKTDIKKAKVEKLKADTQKILELKKKRIIDARLKAKADAEELQAKLAQDKLKQKFKLENDERARKEHLTKLKEKRERKEAIKTKLLLLARLQEENEEIVKMMKKRHYDENKPLPLINILTRTGNRPSYFKELKKTIHLQTNKNIKNYISCDRPDCQYLTGEKNVITVEKSSDNSGFYNLYLNQLAEQCQKGWVIILDDDSKLTDKNFLLNLSRICQCYTSDTIIIYRSLVNKRVLPPNNRINHAKIDMSCLCIHHSVFKDYKFTDMLSGDYRFLILLLLSEQFKFVYPNIPVGVHANYDGEKLGRDV